MNDSLQSSRPRPAAGFAPVLAGSALFLAWQYALALWRLVHSSGEMTNKFSKLARDEYFGFLALQNLHVLLAYGLLALAAALVLQPAVAFWTARSRHRSRRVVVLRALLLTALVHGFFTVRLIKTRPYFINPDEFGRWYYKALDLIPEAAQPVVLPVLFTALPLAVLAAALAWQIRRHGRRGWLAAGVVGAIVVTAGFMRRPPAVAGSGPAGGAPPNVLIIGSDSLRGDALGCAGHRPRRTDGPAAAGVSPHIDALAARSVRFENCYTSIASTMESGVQLMASMYPQSHGIRQMYPDKETVAATVRRIQPLPQLLREKGYDTAAIGDWCAGYYEVLPLGMETLSVSSFDNFKIYMSQAVVMAHFVIPLYFDNPLGYRLFPQLQSFAQFVTPDVVTARVEDRLARVAGERKPFFWHVFYSCNHLPYGSREPYNTMFTEPAYSGPHRGKVKFDIDEFIGGTDLESKWKALSPADVQQIRDLYDGCTRKFDDCVKRILDSLEANGLAENTIVVITADHGDDLYEPGVTLGHGLTFNGGLRANHVPMIVHVPGTAPRVIPEMVRLIDVAPTLADFIGQAPSATWQGRSFAPWIRGEEPPVARPLYAETGFPFIQFRVDGIERPRLPPADELTAIDPDYNFQFVLKEKYRAPLVAAKQRCLRTARWKLVCTPTAQGTRHFALFQMENDPDALTDLAAVRPEVLAPMKTALERWMDEHRETAIAEIFPAGEPE